MRFEGMEIALTEEGAGEPLVFLHGWGACKECFYYQTAYFCRFYRVIAFDFPAFGGSSLPPAAWGVGEYAAFTARLLRARGVSGARLVAHSFGGRVALKLLAEEQDLFSRALLTGCAGVPPRRGLRYKFRVRAYRIAKKIAPRFAERRFGSEEYRKLSPMLRESYKKIVNEDLTPCLAHIRVPVLYVFGQRDTATPPYMAQILHAGTAGSELLFMQGTHFCFSEQPAAFNAAAREFFR